MLVVHEGVEEAHNVVAPGAIQFVQSEQSVCAKKKTRTVEHARTIRWIDKNRTWRDFSDNFSGLVCPAWFTFLKIPILLGFPGALGDFQREFRRVWPFLLIANRHDLSECSWNVEKKLPTIGQPNCTSLKKRTKDGTNESMVHSFDWLIGWLIYDLLASVVAWLIDWLIDWLTGTPFFRVFHVELYKSNWTVWCKIPNNEKFSK